MQQRSGIRSPGACNAERELLPQSPNGFLREWLPGDLAKGSWSRQIPQAPQCSHFLQREPQNVTTKRETVHLLWR